MFPTVIMPRTNDSPLHLLESAKQPAVSDKKICQIAAKNLEENIPLVEKNNLSKSKVCCLKNLSETKFKCLFILAGTITTFVLALLAALHLPKDEYNSTCNCLVKLDRDIVDGITNRTNSTFHEFLKNNNASFNPKYFVDLMTNESTQLLVKQTDGTEDCQITNIPLEPNFNISLPCQNLGADCSDLLYQLRKTGILVAKQYQTILLNLAFEANIKIQGDTFDKMVNHFQKETCKEATRNAGDLGLCFKSTADFLRICDYKNRPV